MMGEVITAVGIDVSKGKSVVAARRPGGEVILPPITINLDRKAGQPVRLSLHLEPKLQ